VERFGRNVVYLSFYLPFLESVIFLAKHQSVHLTASNLNCIFDIEALIRKLLKSDPSPHLISKTKAIDRRFRVSRLAL